MIVLARIDKKGYFVEDVILQEGEEVPSDCIETRPPNGLYKAKWTGTEWIEEGTPPEPQPKPKTQLEILQETVDMLVLDNLGVL